MSNTAAIPSVVIRNRVEDALRTAAKEARSKPVSSIRALLWVALMAAGAATIVAFVRSAAANLETWTLLQADDAAVRSKLANVSRMSASPDYFEALAELGASPAIQDFGGAQLAAKSAVEIDPSRASAWAMLAYLESLKGGRAVPQALDALTRSMNACPLCDQDLIRWRFNFVLTNWKDVPDDLRRGAFEEADILRWIGQNREFLAEMRAKALAAGIPFDEYRAAVKTPVRMWDVGPAPEAVVTDLLRPRT